jgi:hypothetical protein
VKRVRPRAVELPKTLIEELLRDGCVKYNADKKNVVYFGIIDSFVTEAQRRCWEVLWENFLNGNLPMPSELVRNAGGRVSDDVAYVFKRRPIWKAMVRDGRGSIWLRVPDEIRRRAEEAIPYNLDPPESEPTTR